MTHSDTIDWHDFWARADEQARDDAGPSAHHATDAVIDFLRETGVAGAVADVGCGPGHVPFAVAEASPDRHVVGYDAAEPVLEANRALARDRGLDTVRFERAVLPAFEPDRSFGLVFSYFTLCYVADVGRALRAMYEAVDPGGYLVFNYQNRFARAYWRELAANAEERFDEESAFDADRFEDRFSLLLDGENLLSYERIHEILGTWPQSVWSVIDRPDVTWAWRHHPLVYVPK